MTTLALLGWPLLLLALAARLTLPTLILVGVIGGFLLLPTQGGWDFPVLPPFNKNSIPALFLLALAFVMCQSSAGAGAQRADPGGLNRPGWIPRSPAAWGPIALIVLGAFLTVASNGDPLTYGTRRLSGLRPYDAFSIVMLTMVTLVPLILGRKFFAHPERQRLVLQVLVVAALGYSLLALYEIRMSPQLNNMVYGFFPHQWGQHIRGGAWRPVVFLQHGLTLAIFFAMAALAAFGLSRLVRSSDKKLYLLAGGWIFGTLVLSNSLGALIVAVVLLPVVFLLSFRLQLMAAAVVAAITLTYPMLRSADVVPTDRLVSIAAQIDYGRSYSLAFRFNQEDELLEHARQRPLAGWGTFGRHRVFDERGNDTSTTDGMWIITFGMFGWIGYLGQFGLLTLPLMLLPFRIPKSAVDPATATLALVLAAQIVYLLPNGQMSPVSWLIAGALLGRLEVRRSTGAEAEAPAMPRRGAGAYGRSAPSASDLTPPVAAPAKDRGGHVYSRQTRVHHRAQRQGG
jgi:hypothetical protein